MKIKKQKYIGRCDSYCFGFRGRHFDGFPIIKNDDYTKNGAVHLKGQSFFINDRLTVDDSDEAFAFKFCDKL